MASITERQATQHVFNAIVGAISTRLHPSNIRAVMMGREEDSIEIVVSDETDLEWFRIDLVRLGSPCSRVQDMVSTG